MNTANKRLKKILLTLAATLAVATIGGLAVWTAVCPCERTPGFMLLGDVQEEPVQDWSFANDVPLCQLQVYAGGWRPHSINLNCMASPEGDLFLSCSGCTRKYWAAQVGTDEPARLRLNDDIYPVLVNRVTNPATLDQAWIARVTKLQTHGGGAYNPTPDSIAPRPDHWWSFHLVSAN
ncbi:MAG: hypothetical protein ACR2PR_04705 [Pseudohongiellaceae bacterium]